MARRNKIGLREFQQEVVAKLQALSHGGEAPPSSKLGLQAGDQYWLVELADVGEVIPPPELTHVPLSQTWFAGVANVRGNLYSVADFSAFCGGEAVADSADKRLVLVHPKFMVNAGLLVSRLLGLRHAGQLQARDIPAGAASWVCAAYTDNEGHQWQELNVQALVNDHGFLQAGR
ncbi:MAG: chemotaxis protein CheW [Sulfurimicrobium sp.]